MNFPDFEVRKRVKTLGFSTFASRKHEKSGISRRFPENLFPTPFWPPKRTPFSVLATFFRLLAAKKRENPEICAQNAGTSSGKLGFHRFHCFRGRSWSPRGRFRSLRGSISEAPGPDFGAILHKPGQKVRKVRIPKNRRDFPRFDDENPLFSLL